MLEAGESVGRLPQLLFGLRRRGGRLLGLLVLQIALDLELAEIADERTGFAGQTLGLPLKRADSVGDPPCLRLGRLRGLLRPRDGDSQCNRHDSDRNGTRDRRVARNARIIRRGTCGRSGRRRTSDRRGGQRCHGHAGAACRRAAHVRARGRRPRRAVAELARLGAEDDGVVSLVVGLPRRLDGSPSDMTPRVEAFAAELRVRTALPVVLQDERLTSREAESRLALREKDWRVAEETARCGGSGDHPAGLSRRTVMRKLLISLVVIVLVLAAAGALVGYELRRRVHEPTGATPGRSSSSRFHRARARLRFAGGWSRRTSSRTIWCSARRYGGRDARGRSRRASTASTSR